MIAALRPRPSLVLALLTSRSSAPLSSRCFTRCPNLRETVTLVTAAALCLVVLEPAWAGAGRRAAGASVSSRSSPGLALAFKVEPLGMLFALVAVVAVDRQLDLLDRLHARQRRAAPDHILCLLRRGARQHDRDRLRQEPVHAVPVLRAADALDLSAGHPQAERGSHSRRPHLSPAPARAPRSCCSCRRSSPPGCSPARSISRPAASSPARSARRVIALLLALYVFGIGKAAVMPLHFWLPAAMVAPTPVSALLHAVAVVKAGVFTILKVVVLVFGVETLSSSRRNRLWLTVVAGFDDPRRLAHRAAAGQPQAPARLFDRLAALLRRPRRGDPGADLGGRRRPAHRGACRQQDHAVLRGRLDLHRRPSDRGQPARRHRPAHAMDHGRVRHRRARA